MLGDFTCTSAMSGAATNTVEAAPGSLIAVPLLTSSVSVGCCGGTTWLWAKGRPGAPVTDGGAGWAPGGDGTGTGAGVGRVCASRICGAGTGTSGVVSRVGGAVAGTGGGAATVGVRDAETAGMFAGRAVGAG